jgi:hypothetical protein
MESRTMHEERLERLSMERLSMERLDSSPAKEADALVEESQGDRLPQWTAPPPVKGSRVVDALWVGLNACASVAIVFINKL